MHFAQFENLFWIFLALPLLVFFVWAVRNKTAQMRKFAQAELLSEIAQDVSFSRQWVKNILLVGVFVLSAVALARPQWGFEWQEVKRQGIDIVIALDTSKSMLTSDVKPNRLERTKLAVKDLLKKLKGDRIGLIAFAGDAFMACPLTSDYSGFLLSLEDVNVGTIPRGGTNISAALKEAIKGYDNTPAKHKAVIIVTDGENLEGDPVALAKEARSKEVKVFTVGIGTPEGELIQIENEGGQKEFLKDGSGNFVKSRLNESLLQEIALSTGGAYVRAGGAQSGLDLIYDRELSKIEKREIESKVEKKYHERFQYPLAVAVFLLIFETCFPNRRKNK